MKFNCNLKQENSCDVYDKKKQKQKSRWIVNIEFDWTNGLLV